MLADATGTLLNLLALLFGIGVGLAFDEFALWLHLDDVYWSREGRKSIDAVAWALVVTASVPAILDLFTVFEAAGEAGSMWWLPVFLLLLSVVPRRDRVLRGKLVTAALGIVYQPIALLGAIRLAKPGSFWSRHFHGADSRRRVRSERHFGTHYVAPMGSVARPGRRGHRTTHRRSNEVPSPGRSTGVGVPHSQQRTRGHFLDPASVGRRFCCWERDQARATAVGVTCISFPFRASEAGNLLLLFAVRSA